MKIDLKQEPVEYGELSPSKSSYPCVYIRGTDKAGLKVGQSVIIYGTVKSHTERENEDGSSYDCEVECQELEPGKMEPKDRNEGRSRRDIENDDEDAIEKGLQESENKSKSKKDDENEY